MIKVSASYNYCNPNFVIQNLDEPKEWVHPLFAVLKNILMRGCPTIPSLYLRDNFGEPVVEKGFTYNRDFDGLNWEGIICGGANSNPSYDFYHNILTKYFVLGGSFIPECPISDILENLEECDYEGRVDFYSPIYNTVIEIDGSQHRQENQKAKDKQRDELFLRHGISVIRIPTFAISNQQMVEVLLGKVFLKQGRALVSLRQEEPIKKEYIPYSVAIRLQCLLLYLYGVGQVGFNTETIKLSILTDFEISERTIQIIVDDFYLWVENLAGLQGLEFTKPKFNLVLCRDEEALLRETGIKVDISLGKVYCAAKLDDIYYIRNDYFEYETYSLKRVDKRYIYSRHRNYYRVAYEPIHYNLTVEEHGKYLTYILRNISVAEYSGFRANQLEIIIEALNNRCVIGILPTGAGKSLCYQVSALLIPAMTIVVTPLKLLMLDQYEHLCEKMGINHSTYINSSHTEHLALFKKGKSLITLVAPERFFSEKIPDIFSNSKRALHVGFVVIDEAHCLSEWGHDFRTSYLCLTHNLGRFLPSDTFLMALTGTASNSVFKDLRNELSYFKKKEIEAIFAQNMGRDELNIHIHSFESIEIGERNIFRALEDNLLPTLKGEDERKTLVFTKTANKPYGKDNTFSACIVLSNEFQRRQREFGQNVSIDYFAGGDNMPDEAQERILTTFKDGKDLKILFATKAFGMGIDIKDIRKTIHYGLPSSVEDLYQQIGRAGRDGEQADCYIYFEKEREELLNRIFPSGDNKSISIGLISELGAQFNGLETNFYFIENANFILQDEKRIVEHVFQEICRINDEEQYFITAFDVCMAIGEIQHELTDSKIRDKIWKKNSPNTILVEKILYKLFILGEIEMWSMVYVDYKNPTYTNLKRTKLTLEEKMQRLAQHIMRYQTSVELPHNNSFTARVSTLLEWSYETFVMDRLKSLRNLYMWCADQNENAPPLMTKMAQYFSSEPAYMQLVEENVMLDDWIGALAKPPQDTVVCITRLLESYEYMDALNYVSGIARLRLGQFSDFDGARRLSLGLKGVKQFSETERKRLFIATYWLLEALWMKDAFTDKWLQHFPEDVHWIYEETHSEQAEKYLLADFADKLLRIKEKIDARLR